MKSIYFGIKSQGFLLSKTARKYFTFLSKKHNLHWKTGTKFVDYSNSKYFLPNSGFPAHIENVFFSIALYVNDEGKNNMKNCSMWHAEDLHEEWIYLVKSAMTRRYQTCTKQTV